MGILLTVTRAFMHFMNRFTCIDCAMRDGQEHEWIQLSCDSFAGRKQEPIMLPQQAAVAKGVSALTLKRRLHSLYLRSRSQQALYLSQRSRSANATDVEEI